MLKKLLLTTTFALTLAAAQSFAQDASSEGEKTRPNRQEIIDLMVKIGRMPAQQQDSRIDSIRQNAASSKTPRSDFMFCVGLAYLGNYKAQSCAGSAYENGRGIVEDLSEAYAWYSVAHANKIADKAEVEKIEVDQERVKERLLSAYPHPTEDELDDSVKAQQTRIEQYQADIQRVKK